MFYALAGSHTEPSVHRTFAAHQALALPIDIFAAASCPGFYLVTLNRPKPQRHNPSILRPKISPQLPSLFSIHRLDLSCHQDGAHSNSPLAALCHPLKPALALQPRIPVPFSSFSPLFSRTPNIVRHRLCKAPCMFDSVQGRFYSQFVSPSLSWRCACLFFPFGGQECR